MLGHTQAWRLQRELGYWGKTIHATWRKWQMCFSTASSVQPGVLCRPRLTTRKSMHNPWVENMLSEGKWIPLIPHAHSRSHPATSQKVPALPNQAWAPPSVIPTFLGAPQSLFPLTGSEGRTVGMSEAVDMDSFDSPPSHSLILSPQFQQYSQKTSLANPWEPTTVIEHRLVLMLNTANMVESVQTQAREARLYLNRNGMYLYM